MKKLAICIPTYGSAPVIKDFVDYYADFFKIKDICWYIYDSSEDDDTQRTVAGVVKENDNIFYERLDSSIHSNSKVYKAYREIYARNEFSYIWLIADYIRISLELLDKVIDLMIQSPDLIVIKGDSSKENISVYRDPNSLFHDYAYWTTLYGAVIVNIQTIIMSADWDYLIDRYCDPKRINYSHVALYFEQLGKLNESNSILIRTTPSDFFSFQRENSIWVKETIYMLAVRWRNTILALPDSYTDKDYVIKSLGTKAGTLSHSSLLHLKRDNYLSLIDFLRFCGIWRKISNVPRLDFFLISLLPQKRLYLLSSSFKRKLNKFCEKHRHLYIYGCGVIANKYADILDSDNIPFLGFVVTSLEGEKKSIRGHTVSIYDEKIFDDIDVGMIMGMNQKNVDMVEKEKHIFAYGDRVLYIDEARFRFLYELLTIDR